MYNRFYRLHKNRTSTYNSPRSADASVVVQVASVLGPRAGPALMARNFLWRRREESTWRSIRTKGRSYTALPRSDTDRRPSPTRRKESGPRAAGCRPQELRVDIR